VSTPAERRPRVPLRIGVVAVAVIALLIQLPGLASVSKTRESQSNFNKGNNPAALAEASDAIDSEPWAASPYVQRALVEESMNRLGAARTDLVRAEKREPYNFRHPLVLARIDAELGDVNTALDDFRRAKRLRPRSPLVAPQP
jgi:tetratricopeptide (TPR) repeat protein